MNKRYYWFKLKDDFFLSKEIKIIRKLPSGAEIIIILLKLQLYSLKTNGIIEIDGVCETIEEEISILIDEDTKMIKLALAALKRFSLIDVIDKNDIKMLLHDDLIGSETASTIRSRKSRAKKALQCNSNATKCNTDIEIDIDKDIDKEKKRFKKPAIEEIDTYLRQRQQEKKINHNFTAESFYDYYQSKNWKIGKNKMKDWKAAIRTWENRQKKDNQKKINRNDFEV